MPGARSIVVAGAGAIGRTVAYALVRAGYAVTVVDPDPEGGRASRIAAGMLAPAFESLFDGGGHVALLRAALGYWEPLSHEIGLTIAEDGAMAVGTRGQAEAWAADLAALGVSAKLSDLGGGRWGVFSDLDRQLDPKQTLASLRRGAEQRGVRFMTGRVAGFAGGLVEIDGDEPVAADTLVIATGADKRLAQLAPELAHLTPIKGHILRADVAFARKPVIRTPTVYVCRTPRGAVLGATMEVGLDDTAVDPAVVRKLAAAGAQLVDGLDRLDWTAAAGVRAATPDGLPMVGPGATPGVVLAVGARRNGWLLAPMIAEVVLGAVQGRPTNAAAALFDPRRF